MSGINELVITEGNRRPFETVIGITHDHDCPVRAFLYGPSGSGKTALIQARARERDLLSSKQVVSCHVSELLSFFNLGEFGEHFLERVGTADVLLLDNLEIALDTGTNAGELCRLLLEARDNCPVDTIVTSSLRKDAFSDTGLASVLRGYEQMEIVPLDESGMFELVRKLQHSLQVTGKRPELEDGAIEYLVESCDGDCAELSQRTRFLLTAAGFPAGARISAADARELLS